MNTFLRIFGLCVMILTLHEGKCQPAITRDALGTSLDLEDLLEMSSSFDDDLLEMMAEGMCDDNNDQLRPESFQDEEEDPLGTSLIAEGYFLGSSIAEGSGILSRESSLSSQIYLPEEMFLDDDLDWDESEPSCSTPKKALDLYNPTKARPKSTKPTQLYTAAELKPQTKRKKDALDLINIKKVSKEKCFCGQGCIEKSPIKDIMRQRWLFWSKPRYLKVQWLIQCMDLSIKQGKFRYFTLETGKSVCVAALRKILSVGKNYITKIYKLHNKKSVTNGGFYVRKDSDTTLNAVSWLEEYIKFHGDRLPNAEIVLLPQKTVKKKIFEKYQQERENSGLSYVKKSTFYDIMAKRFPHVKIRQTNPFSKCTTCITLEKEKEKEIDPQKRALINQKMDEHNNRQMEERRYYCVKKEESQLNPERCMSIIIDGMDQAKTCLPHFAGRQAKCINPVDLLKTHITGVLNHGHGGFHSYLDFCQYQHDPNLTINVILKAIDKADSRMPSLPPILYIQADNCWRENKNRFVLGFLQLLVARNIFKEVHLSFLYVGHTHEDIDAQFSVVSRMLKRNDVETISEFLKILGNSEILNNMFDVRNWLEPHLNELTHISKPKHFKFVKTVENVKVFYKGKQDDNWIYLPASVLMKIPGGKPKRLIPNFDFINKEAKLKQIKQIGTFFKNENSIGNWEKFYKKLSDGSNSYRWILDDLRQQTVTENTQTTIPSYIQELMDKEEAIPKIQTKHRSRSNGIKKPKNSRAQSKPRKQKGKQRRSSSAKRILIILNKEEKKHIWFKIFCDIFLFSYLVLYILMYLLNIICILEILYTLCVQWIETVLKHIGDFALKNIHFIPSLMTDIDIVLPVTLLMIKV